MATPMRHRHRHTLVSSREHTTVDRSRVPRQKRRTRRFAAGGAAAVIAAGPSRASVITYINPLVAVLLGVVVLDEHLGPTSVAGLVLILGGSWLSTGGRVPFTSQNGK